MICVTCKPAYRLRHLMCVHRAIRLETKPYRRSTSVRGIRHREEVIVDPSDLVGYSRGAIHLRLQLDLLGDSEATDDSDTEPRDLSMRSSRPAQGGP